MEKNSVKKIAEKVILEFDTNDIFVIAEKSGVKIIYETWQPVTLGEFHQKTKTIYVNLNANVARERIIAHELGHYFFRTQFDFQNSDIEEENFCDEFVKELLKNEQIQNPKPKPQNLPWC